MTKTIAIDARIINSSTGRYVERLLHYLEQLDKTNTYYILVPTKDLDYFKPQNPNFKMMAADFANYSFAEQIGFKKFLNQLHPDLVHFCMPQQPILYEGAHVTTVHDLTLLNTYNSDKNWLVYKAKQLVGQYVFKRVGQTSAHIITPTNYVKKAYSDFAKISSSKITVTYEGCELSTTRPKEYPPLKDKKFILYVGQQSSYKNIRRLMQAHQQLLQKHPDLLLVLVGRLTGKNAKPLLANQAWAKKQGYKGIEYTGFLPDEQLLWCMQHTQAYVFPSLSEGFGLPALEAMAAGAPVVSSNSTCLPEVYGNATIYFDPKNTNQMAAKILEVLDNPKLSAELIKKGREQAAKYSWRKMAKQTLEVYNKVLFQ